ncbi:MAG: hypothetical protein PUC12_14545 [Clostridiales bacterium]|nr:hypothetical protein [Clostridiales bacterium]
MLRQWPEALCDHPAKLVCAYGKYAEYLTKDPVSKGVIGEAQIRLMKQRDIVDYAVGWIENNRVFT